MSCRVNDENPIGNVCDDGNLGVMTMMIAILMMLSMLKAKKTYKTCMIAAVESLFPALGSR